MNRIRYYRRYPSAAPRWYLVAEGIWELLPLTGAIVMICCGMAAWN